MKSFAYYPRRLQSRGRVVKSVCLFVTTVCRFVLRAISKNDAARITKLDIGVFHYESRKDLFILGSKSQRSMSRVNKNNAGVGLCTLVSAGFF